MSVIEFTAVSFFSLPLARFDSGSFDRHRLPRYTCIAGHASVGFARPNPNYFSLRPNHAHSLSRVHCLRTNSRMEDKDLAITCRLIAPEEPGKSALAVQNLTTVYLFKCSRSGRRTKSSAGSTSRSLSSRNSKRPRRRRCPAFQKSKMRSSPRRRRLSSTTSLTTIITSPTVNTEMYSAPQKLNNQKNLWFLLPIHDETHPQM